VIYDKANKVGFCKLVLVNPNGCHLYHCTVSMCNIVCAIANTIRLHCVGECRLVSPLGRLSKLILHSTHQRAIKPGFCAEPHISSDQPSHSGLPLGAPRFAAHSAWVATFVISFSNNTFCPNSTCLAAISHLPSDQHSGLYGQIRN
jgi:hypothetical protein